MEKSSKMLKCSNLNRFKKIKIPYNKMSGTGAKEVKWFCETCQCSFQRRFALEKHYKSRKHLQHLEQVESKPDELVELRRKNEELEIQVQDLKIEMEKLKTQISKKPKRSYSNSYHYENCTINNNIQLNLTINPHGAENWDYLKDEVLNLMKGVNTCIPEMVKKLHFNREHPENHNLKLPNKRFPDMKTFNGDKWNTHHKKDVIEALIIQLVDKLEDEYGDDFRNQSTRFIQTLWEQKTGQIISEQKVDRDLRRQVEYSIIDGQNDLKD